jgi:hypothetical protein
LTSRGIVGVGTVRAEEDQVIKPEDIHYYDERPQNAVASIKDHGIDLAISHKENADYTTNVTGEVFYEDANDPQSAGALWTVVTSLLGRWRRRNARRQVRPCRTRGRSCFLVSST